MAEYKLSVWSTTVVKHVLSWDALVSALYGVVWTAVLTGVGVVVTAFLFVILDSMGVTTMTIRFINPSTVATVLMILLYWRWSFRIWRPLPYSPLVSLVPPLVVLVYSETRFSYVEVWVYLVAVRMSFFPHAWMVDTPPSLLFWGLEYDTWSWLLSACLVTLLSIASGIPYTALFLFLVSVTWTGLVSRTLRYSILRRRLLSCAHALESRIRTAIPRDLSSTRHDTPHSLSSSSLPPPLSKSSQPFDILPDLASRLIEDASSSSSSSTSSTTSAPPWCLESCDWWESSVHEQLVLVPDAWYDYKMWYPLIEKHTKSAVVESTEIYVCVRGTHGSVSPSFRIPVHIGSWYVAADLKISRVHANLKWLEAVMHSNLVCSPPALCKLSVEPDSPRPTSSGPHRFYWRDLHSSTLKPLPLSSERE